MKSGLFSLTNFMPFKKFFLVAFFSWLGSLFGFGATTQSNLSIDLTNNIWKFKTGDTAIWSEYTFDDANWQHIKVGNTFESEIGKEFDGIAWYRTAVTIPNAWKSAIKKSDTLTLKLGKIDDADETFFNGVRIGATGKFPPENITAYDQDREYFIPANLIKYDLPNTIAVRVADWGGNGGMYAGEYAIAPSNWCNKTKIELLCSAGNYSFNKDSPVQWSINIKNNSREDIGGTLTVDVTTYMGAKVATQTKTIQVLAKKELKIDGFDFGMLPPDFYHINVKLRDANGLEAKDKSGFAVAPDSLQNTPHIPMGFQEFWQKTRNELDSVEPNFKLTLIPKYTTDSVNVYEIEMRSLGNVRIGGYYAQPVNALSSQIGGMKKGLPAILHVQGYSSVMTPSGLRTDVAQFFLNIRGHGNSKKDINPGFPGYLLKGLDSAENYIYRGAYMDCIRAVDFLCSRAEIDTHRIAVMGGSQGGALSFVTTALDKRIKLCAPDVPFLSNFRLYFQIANWPANEFKPYAITRFKTLDKLFSLLDYFDVSHFTPLITCPVIMGVGLYDDICPPAINFSAYNNLSSSDKQYVLYPKSGHGLPSEQYDIKINWILKHFTL